jgi:integral membrane protein (TIGR01906 family)
LVTPSADADKGEALTTIARWLFILCLPVILITASVLLAANSRILYNYGFEKYDISQATGLADSELDKVARELIQYFGSQESISLEVEREGETFELFNAREVLHLEDVKALFRLDYIVLLSTLGYALSYIGVSFILGRLGFGRRLSRAVIAGSVLTLFLMLAAGLATFFNFDGFFYQFHVFSFANDFWQLDPATDFLIMLFPQGFWYDATVAVALITAAAALVLGGAAWLYLRKTRGNDEENNGQG